jgi:hypothetical protein
MAAAAPPPLLGPLRVQTVCGSGRIGSTDGPSDTATFSFPHSVLPLPDGSALVSDSNNNAVRHISIDHSGSGRFVVRRVGARGFTWLRPRGMAQMADGGVLVCDSGHNRIRLLGADGSVSVFAGSGRKGMADGPAHGASFNTPSGLFVCSDGTVLVADTGNNAIRIVAPTASARLHGGGGSGGGQRVVSTLAGCGRDGHADGPAGAAKFDKPTAVLALGPPSGLASGESVVYVADSANHCLRIISSGPSARGGGRGGGAKVGRGASADASAGELFVGTLCGRPGFAGHADGKFADVLMACPTGLAVLPDGTLAVSDASSNVLRRVHVEAQRVSRLAGVGDRAYGLVDGPAEEARFNGPKGLAVSSGGEVWLADSQNHCIRLLREDEAARMSDAAAKAASAARARPAILSLPAPQSAASWAMDGPDTALERHDRSAVESIDAAVAAAQAAGAASALPASPGPHHQSPPRASPPRAAWVDESAADVGDGGGSPAGTPLSLRVAPPPPLQPTESFATSGFAAEAQLFEREVPKTRSGEARGGWTYSGAASVSLVRCAPRAARLTVQVHGAASAEVSVLRPSQMRLRDTAFVVCSHDPSFGSGYTGFGVNELGLRFRTTTAAASLLAACEAIVGDAADAEAAWEEGRAPSLAPSDAVKGALMDALSQRAPPPPPRPTTGEAFARVSAPSSPSHHRARDGQYAFAPQPAPASAPSSPSAVPPGSSRRSSLPGTQLAVAAATRRQSAGPSGIPTLRRPRPGAPSAPEVDSAEARLQLAEQDVLRLSARLAERDLEASRLHKRLEQAQAQVRSRDAKVAELTRRLALLGKPPSPMRA